MYCEGLGFGYPERMQVIGWPLTSPRCVALLRSIRGLSSLPFSARTLSAGPP